MVEKMDDRRWENVNTEEVTSHICGRNTITICGATPSYCA